MKRVKRKRLPTVEHLIPVPKADSVIMIEIAPTNTNHKLHIFLSHEKIPTYRSFDYTAKVSDLPKRNETEILPDFDYHYWFVKNSQIQNRTGGRWFMNVMELSEDLTDVSF